MMLQHVKAHYCPDQITSPVLKAQSQDSLFIFPEPPVSPPHPVLQCQTSTPHLVPQTQVSYGQLAPQNQESSSHLVPKTQITSPHLISHPEVSSCHAVPESQVTSPHFAPHPNIPSPHLVPHAQATSLHLLHSQRASPHSVLHHEVTSPHHCLPHLTSPTIKTQSKSSLFHFPHPHKTSPHFVPYPQVSSPHIVPQTQLSFPYFTPEMQISSAHCSPQTQVTSPHCVPLSPVSSSPFYHQPQVASSQLAPKSQTTSPYPSYANNTPHNFEQQVTSPHLMSQAGITSPHLLSQPQHLIFSQTQDPDPGNPNWAKCEPSSELSCFLGTDNLSIQNQTLVHVNVQNQNQFFTGLSHQRDEMDNTFKPYDNPLVSSSECAQRDLSDPGQDTWETLDQTLSQVQSSTLGPVSSGGAMGKWGTVDFNSSSAEGFNSTQFVNDGYVNTPQPFCSPTTPGPSPHYPETPTDSRPGLHFNSRKDRQSFPVQLTRDPTAESYSHHLHQTSQPISLCQTEPIQDLKIVNYGSSRPDTSFSPEDRNQQISSAIVNLRENCKRRRGGHQPNKNWMKQSQPDAGLRDSRLLCVVCKRDFRSLPALNGHMRSHTGFRSATFTKKNSSQPALPSVSMLMPVSVPITKSRGTSKACRSGQTTCGHLPSARGGTALYRSLMHADDDAGGHYTPPPMLCPLRAGPGLYCSLLGGRQQKVQAIQLHNGFGHIVAIETACPETPASGDIKPRINLGPGFQAEIPPLQDRKNTPSDSHNALLLWRPCGELERPVNQHRVEALLMMARSSVVPGGEASPEYALHVLSESRGDFLMTVEKLLSTSGTKNNSSGSRAGLSWTAAEKRLLVKSLQLHQKDFRSVQKAVRTKSISECIEFYYLWKKKLSLRAKTPEGLTVRNGQKSSRCQEAS
ncbi:uncharacterized protein KZ484_019475 isoform 2-T2 [Pholidichthys leucotaenia]